MCRIDTRTGDVSLRMLWGHSMDQATVSTGQPLPSRTQAGSPAQDWCPTWALCCGTQPHSRLTQPAIDYLLHFV